MRLSVKNQILLVIDDDPMVGKVLERIQEASNVIQANSLDEARKLLGKVRPYCVFLDIFLGVNENGLSILPEIKRRWPFVPVIVATGDGDNSLIADALSAGADDFVKKPLSREEVTARVQVRVEQARLSAERDSLRVGDLTLFSHKGVIRVGKRVEQLSPTNHKILRALLASNGALVSKAKLKSAAWSRDKVSDNSLDRKLHQLRVLLKDLGSQVEIVSLYGAGVQLQWKQAGQDEV